MDDTPSPRRATNSSLEVRGLKKNYGGVQALRGVDFELRAGEIHALCGENGAGKSTLVKILGGLVTQSEGEISVDGIALKPGKRTDPRLISIVHQELSIIPDLSVLDNVLMGDDSIGEIIFRRRYAADVRQKLNQIGLGHVDLAQQAGTLTLAEQQLVEIARGVARGAKILLLDEPTATLSDVEIKRVFTAVRWLKQQGGTVVFISHRLPEVFELTDRVTVFRNGQKVMTAQTADLTTDDLVEAMIGRTVASREGVSETPIALGEERLRVEAMALAGHYAPVDLRFRAGEIVAIVGQLGSGADLMVETMAGLRCDHAGAIMVDGEMVSCRSTRGALNGHIAYVPEDRAGKGVFLDAPVMTNITASILDRVTKGGFLQSTTADAIGTKLAAQFTIDRRRLGSNVSHLSGGNQQKVAIAKAAALCPKILLLNEPTRGVDIGARTEIYKELRSLAADGMIVIFFTTDVEEVLELADRVITVFRGQCVADRSIQDLGMDDILADILHGPQHNQEKAA